MSAAWPAELGRIAPPPPPDTELFRLDRLAPEHNERDHAAWMSSIDHIHATKGFAPGDWGGDEWPFEMDAEQNLADLVMHADEFDRGIAFAYTVLGPDDDVIGCVYIDPDPTGAADVMMRCWVRVSHAHLDRELAGLVVGWLMAEWPFRTIRTPGRP